MVSSASAAAGSRFTMLELYVASAAGGEVHVDLHRLDGRADADPPLVRGAAEADVVDADGNRLIDERRLAVRLAVDPDIRQLVRRQADGRAARLQRQPRRIARGDDNAPDLVETEGLVVDMDVMRARLQNRPA